ncbi:MAG: hypothetical protein U1E39_14310 [Planctomycetota bacterium]
MSFEDAPVPLLVGAVVAALVTGVVRWLALRRGVVDEPDPSRRLHTAPVPRLGGVGIAAGLAAALLAAWGLVPEPEDWLLAAARGTLSRVAMVLAAAFAVGLVDDLRPRGKGLPAWTKLVAQAGVGALAVFVARARFDGTPWGPWGELPLGGAAEVLTVLWFVAVLNVVNFMDGSDAIVAAMAVVILAAAGGEHPAAAAGTLLPAAAAAFGFLAWNAPPAKIFMGDGGSHLLGAAIAIAPCAVPAPGGQVVVPGAPWVLVGAALLPSIVDVAEALLHKVRHRIPMSQAHHDHLYQRLVKATGSHGAVALRYGLLTLAAVLVVGPLAQAAGVPVACAVGAAVLAVHLADGHRRTRGVKRLGGT